MKSTNKKELVIKMRLTGMSYSQIREKVSVSKSTLSLWLERYPLPKERMRELRDLNPKRIENCRNTKHKKRQAKLAKVYAECSEKIGVLSQRELFLAGLFLYWGEGTKTSRDMVILTNTDPSMIRFFIKWLGLFRVNKQKLRVKLHLYKDMEVEDKTMFWSKTLGISKKNFRKPYIKNSKFSSITYNTVHKNGTCSIIYGGTDLYNNVMMSLKYFREVVSSP